MFRTPDSRLARLLALCAVAAGACANESDDPAGQSSAGQQLADSGTDAAAEAESCEPPATRTGTCEYAKALMVCHGRGGTTVECVGECPADLLEDQGVRPGDCENICSPGEYAAGCGGIGPMAPSAAPPSPDCHGMGNPGGSAQYCCPCE